MPLPPWHEVAFNKEHEREHFDCGDPALNEFLRKHARKNHERGSSKTFVAVPDASPLIVLGFYSISPASVAYERTPEIARKRLARYATTLQNRRNGGVAPGESRGNHALRFKEVESDFPQQFRRHEYWDDEAWGCGFVDGRGAILAH